jgi:flagellar assembly protein FliH
MGLIRAVDAPSSAAVFSLRDIEAQAQAILLRAQQQAEQLLAQAQEEAMQLKEEARAEGLAAGHAEGLKRGHEEGLKRGRDQALAEHKVAFTAAVSALNKAASAIDQSRLSLEADAVEEVLRLAIAIAGRVTKQHALADPSIAVANVAEALKLAVHAADVAIVIHPAQRAAIDASLPDLRLKLPQLQHLRLVEDATVEPGGCRLLTGSGGIDATLETQLNRIVADLLPDVKEAANEPL